jgi:hypothetical protein
MSEQNLKSYSGRIAERTAAPERCSHAFMAVAVGTITFFASLWFLQSSIALPPIAQRFTGWAGAGPMAALMAACLAPRRRWMIALPLLVILEWGAAVAAISLHGLLAGGGRLPGETGMLTGAIVGFALGIVLIAMCRAAMPPGRRWIMVGLVAVILLAARLTLPVLGEHSLAGVKHRLPYVEEWLRTEILVKTVPVSWGRPYWMGSLDCAPWVSGQMAYRSIRLELYLDPPGDHPFGCLVDRPGKLEGWRVGGAMWLPQPRGLSNHEFITPAFLEAMGVQPKLAHRFRPAGDQEVAATYHGITYHAVPNHWGHGADNWLILAFSGTYKPSARTGARR